MGLSAQPALAYEASIASPLLLPLQPIRRVRKMTTPLGLARKARPLIGLGMSGAARQLGRAVERQPFASTLLPSLALR